MEENITSLNKQAVALLKKKNYSGSFSLLFKSLSILSSAPESITVFKLFSLTFSNLSAAYKETGKNAEAISCLLKLVDIEKRIPENKYNTVNAYLNLCALYSANNDHELALRYGMTGLIILQKEFPLPERYVPNLIIAYHNVGVEYEFLNRIDDAIDCYKKG